MKRFLIFTPKTFHRGARTPNDWLAVDWFGCGLNVDCFLLRFGFQLDKTGFVLHRISLYPSLVTFYWRRDTIFGISWARATGMPLVRIWRRRREDRIIPQKVAA